ncbi:MAG: S1 RNA-binding domain-containing protein, partial [Chromatiales bacterium]|nr:S1 RNA-binding domain-containing protein [Chromatiales bacterium]
MSTELLINVTPRETRVAFIENGMLQELTMERTSSRGIVGNVYKGRVSRVLPGMQAAFVDIGLERAAFLHASDVVAGGLCFANSAATGGSGLLAPIGRTAEAHSNGQAQDSIARLVHEGQDLLVQVVKDPIGTKGARLSTRISIPACYLVYLPHNEGSVGISQRIEDEATREQLRDLVTQLLEENEPGGYIVRTAAETAVHDHIEA